MCVCALLCMAAIAVHAPVAVAQDAAKQEADLKKIRARIDTIRQTIQADSKRRDALAGQLQEADVEIKNARAQTADLRKQREASEQRLAELNRERAAIERRIAAQRSALAAELRAAYINGREEQLKLLLNQQDPTEMERMLAYYGYFGRARAERIAAIGEQLRELDALGAQIEAQTADLRQLEQNQQAQVKRLADARKRRAQTLASVQSKLKSRGDQLASLQRQAATLERLLDELRSAAEEFPAFTGRPFAQLRGRLPWPVKGKVAARFGSLRAGGPLKWEGTLIEASPGTQARAPAPGRVIYSDWLNGMGFLVVLDHGDGYLSLYGHNEQLYRQVGDTVAAGDVLGDLGDRGNGKGELYMEIRSGKRPQDPERWLRKP